MDAGCITSTEGEEDWVVVDDGYCGVVCNVGGLTGDGGPAATVFVDTKEKRERVEPIEDADCVRSSEEPTTSNW